MKKSWNFPLKMLVETRLPKTQAPFSGGRFCLPTKLFSDSRSQPAEPKTTTHRGNFQLLLGSCADPETNKQEEDEHQSERSIFLQTPITFTLELSKECSAHTVGKHKGLFLTCYDRQWSSKTVTHLLGQGHMQHLVFWKHRHTKRALLHMELPLQAESKTPKM